MRNGPTGTEQEDLVDENLKQAVRFISGPRISYSWAPLGALLHAWPCSWVTALGHQVKPTRTLCGLEAIVPEAFTFRSDGAICVACRAVEARPLAAEFAKAEMRGEVRGAAKERAGWLGHHTGDGC
jgi:hypothetical protein